MAIETETKFSIPDLATFRILRNLTRLNGFQFQPAGKKIVSYQYIDTEDRRLFLACLACRFYQIQPYAATLPRSTQLYVRREKQQLTRGD